MAPFFRYSKEKNELTIDFGSSDEPAPTPTSDPTPEGPADTTSLPRFRGMPPPPPLTLTNLWRGDAESLCAPTKADCVYEPTLVQAPAVSGDRAEDTPHTPPVVASPSESKTPTRTAHLSLIFTDEAELCAEPKPAILPGSDSFFSGWVIFDQFFRPRVKTAEEERVANLPIPRRTGWMFIDMFLPREGATDTPRGSAAGGSTKPRFSFLTKFLMLALPLLAFVGYYQYASVSGATILGKTLSNSVNLERGLVGHWTFDGSDIDMSSSTAEIRDRSVYGNHGDWQNYGTGSSTLAAGKLGQGLWSKRFNITSSPRIHIATSSIHNNISPMTLSAWVKVPTGGGGFVFNKSYGGNDGWYLGAHPNTSGGSSFGIDCSGPNLYKTWGGPFGDNQWHHYLVTYDGGLNHTGIRIYIDGSEVISTSGFNTNCGSRWDDSSSPLHIGYSQSSNSSFDGSLDDVRIYNRVLSAKEIERLYKMGEGVKINTNTIPAGSTLEDGLVGYWSFNGADFTDKVYDRSGQNNHGYLVNMATTSAKMPGKVGQGLNFDGINDYVEIANNASLNSSTTFAVSLWLKRLGSNWQTLYSSGQQTFAWTFGLQGANGYLWVSKTGGGGDWFSTTRIADNAWHHVAIVKNGNSGSNLTFYLDGVANGTASIGSVNTPTGIKKIGNDGVTYAQSTLDEVRIYNRALSADEVRQLYESGGGSTVGMCGQGPVLDADGNKYGIVQIGTQCWLDRNMNVGTRVNNSTAQTNNATTEKWCYNNTDSNCTTNNPIRPDGGLYQWNEAMQYVTTEGARGICPTGWHIPTDAEWYTLENFLKDNGQECSVARTGDSCASAGTKLMRGGSSGFEANLAGTGSAIIFSGRATAGGLMSSSESGGNAWNRGVNSSSVQMGRYADVKSFGLSVRCLKD